MHMDQSLTMINDTESYSSLYISLSAFNSASDSQTVILRNVMLLIRLLGVKEKLSL